MSHPEPNDLSKLSLGLERKIFDPRDLSTDSQGAELLDASVVLRGNQWWMYLAGQAAGYGPTEIYSASLLPGVPLSAAGWRLTRTTGGQLVSLASQNTNRLWDGQGGRHCPSYVRGFDPNQNTWVERIYYAGAAESLWGPYTIGFLEWNGENWIEQHEPAFQAEEDWERGSVYEPNLIYHEGKWKMWYVAGSSQEDYFVQGYAESEDGRSGWIKHSVFAPPQMRMFDFCVRQRSDSFHAVFARIWGKEDLPPPEIGLWWCCAEQPSADLADWSEPVQIMTAEDRGWHAGPWKPSLAFHEQTGGQALLFFDGLYQTTDPGPFPFAFTLGCAELTLPFCSHRVQGANKVPK